MINDPIGQDLIRRMYLSRITQINDWLNSPMMVAAREQRRLAWLALPWYVRAWRVTRVRVDRWRERLGEVIAGREFE